MPCEIYSNKWCKKQTFPTASMVLMLQKREIGFKRQGNTFIKGSREFYHCIPINKSIRTLNRPSFLPLQFTPDGKALIGLATNLKEIYIFEYAGVNYVSPYVHSNKIFKILFPRQKIVDIWNCSVHHYLNFSLRDSCQITPDSKHLIVSSSVFILDHNSRISGIQKNNESIEPGPSLEHFHFYCIDIDQAKVVDVLVHEFDKIKMVQGVHLLERTLAILSIQHQTIYLYQIHSNTGFFILITQIGRQAFDDDNIYLSNLHPVTEKCFTTFRQYVLSCFYHQAKADGKESVTRFLRNFSYYQQLRMCQLQLLEPKLILIRIDNRVGRPNLLKAIENFGTVGYYFFVLFDWEECKIVRIFDRDSEILFDIFQKFNSIFHLTNTLTNHFPTSLDHCKYIREEFEFYKQNTANFSSKAEVRRHIMNCLPYSKMNLPLTSPYLDPQLFFIDERVTSIIERARYTLTPLKIFSRKTRRIHVNIDFEITRPSPNYNFIRIIFHPFDPFCLSVNRNPLDKLMSFHVPDRVL